MVPGWRLEQRETLSLRLSHWYRAEDAAGGEGWSERPPGASGTPAEPKRVGRRRAPLAGVGADRRRSEAEPPIDLGAVWRMRM